MSLRHPLAAVRGLGSAKEGTHHWIVQRITAVALMPLTVWFFVAALGTLAGSYADARSFLAQPWNGVLMAAFVLCLFYHAALGLQVVVEDYVHTRGLEVAMQIGIKLISVFAALASLLAIVRISLGG
jgi:succinate dehydrogenase / fumarate reductase membrane anchor subunit